MSLNISNNTTAFNVLSSYTSNMVGLKKSMSRLSRGTKEVSDDPSGIGISERMRSQIRASGMARNNVENGISLIQTADAWMQRINDMLGRMHELAVEANDGTKTSIDKTNIQGEYKELQDEIARITSKSTSAAKFNGLYLFRGGNGNAVTAGDGVGSGKLTVQVGSDVDQEMTVTLADLQVTNSAAIGTVHVYTYSTNHSVTGSTHTAVSWGSVIDSVKSSVASTNVVGMLQSAIDHVSNSRSRLGAQQSRFEQTRNGLLAHEDNMRAAESKIRDVDVARESTELAKYQVLTQVANAMLTQANQLPASATRLLGG